MGVSDLSLTSSSVGEYREALDLPFLVILVLSELEFDTVLVDMLVLTCVVPVVAFGTILSFFWVSLARGSAGALRFREEAMGDSKGS